VRLFGSLSRGEQHPGSDIDLLVDLEPGRTLLDLVAFDVAGLRDLIAHEYFRIKIDRMLDIVERDLPALEQAIARLLERSEQRD
jgi:predicted nucleotidyltransferase